MSEDGHVRHGNLRSSFLSFFYLFLSFKSKNYKKNPVNHQNKYNPE
jgi:hypothetical protein